MSQDATLPNAGDPGAEPSDEAVRATLHRIAARDGTVRRGHVHPKLAHPVDDAAERPVGVEL